MTKETLKEQFRKGAISKPEFIGAMYQKHQELFEYCNLLQSCDLDQIEITAEGIFFVSKHDRIRIFCKKADQRTAPFEIMNFDAYENEDSDLLYRLTAHARCIFDVGANIGWYSIGLAKKRPLATIFSFEPLAETFLDLKKNVALNQLANVIIHPFGFSNLNTTLTFYSSVHTSVSNSAENISGDAEVKESVCEVKRMDDFVKEGGHQVDFIKCDVEGAELFVFQGGIQTIQEHKPVIFCEMLRKWAAKFNYHPNDIIQLLGTVGYHCYINKGENQLEQLKEVTSETLQTNFFFLHPSQHASIIEQHVKK